MSSARRTPRWGLGAALALVACLLLGYLAAGLLNDALAISYNEKDLPVEPTLVAPTDAPAEVRPIESIALPAGASDDPLLTAASSRFAQAIEGATGQAPSTTEDDGTAADATPDFVVAEDPSLPAGSYRLDASGVTGADRNGIADGLFAAALSIEAGRGHGEPCEEVVQLVVELFAGRCLEMHFLATGAAGNDAHRFVAAEFAGAYRIKPGISGGKQCGLPTEQALGR